MPTPTVIIAPSIRPLPREGEWAWPTGPAIAAWRRLVRLGLAEESLGICEGCARRAHRPGEAHRVPVFRLAEGVKAQRA